MIQMGHSLGLDVLAEGIETKEQENHLRILGCDAGQGYLYAKPLSVKRCEEYLQVTDWV
ncbi:MULTISPECIES: EAL domain-containing protein [Marinobacter]|uniref:EAL domain-containing protein n=1 Tax=Marinobacter TaxID=2742 RepID=UPI001F337359|nr:EAL domain-containing protein [Marinobacter alexandrii]MCK7553303.1 EAL domain-containing protein [Marinobacter goseongensis]MDX5388126.1 EAL domain-containing protein [Marinobacter sp.]MDX5440251.1 EAL domain-containing protein [Alteromonadaceae bacterium]WBU43182.1 EAL domain-containing protein [Marinobacter alkaliphilus]